jgi:hypothetical protein
VVVVVLGTVVVVVVVGGSGGGSSSAEAAGTLSKSRTATSAADRDPFIRTRSAAPAASCRDSRSHGPLFFHGLSVAPVFVSPAFLRPHEMDQCAITAAVFAGRKNVGNNAGSRRRFWSLASAVGASYVITAALIPMRTSGL